MSELAHILAELQYSADRKGPWKMYIHDRGGTCRRGTWFANNPTSIAFAGEVCDVATSDNREVRACDGGDNLVFHAKDGQVLYGANFWQEIGA